MRLIDADALYNGSMKDEYFAYKAKEDNGGRESFAYSCAMERLAEAPTIPAIPVEWLKTQMNEALDDNEAELASDIDWLIRRYMDEQEAI